MDPDPGHEHSLIFPDFFFNKAKLSKNFFFFFAYFYVIT